MKKETEDSKPKKAARTKSLAPMMLPFWDDFSFTDGMTPHDSLWENSDGVWINTGMGINSPTVYAATFDGLDSTGLPYNEEVLANGYTDRLTSRPIRLDVIPTSEQGGVFLSFFYQWHGNGEPPDNGDYLAVEFKNRQDKWVERQRIVSTNTLDRTVFYYSILLVGDTSFFHDDFQFRFRIYGRESGPYDTWNVDYVYLNDNRNVINSFPDRALASELGSLFGEYRSVPIKHFLDNVEFDSVSFSVQNLRIYGLGDANNYEVNGSFRNYFYGADTTYTDYTTPLYNFAGLVLLPKERVDVKSAPFPDTNDPLQFDPDADALDITLETILISDDQNDADQTFVDEGIDARVNDTTYSTHHLSNFYAYDDGTAEYAVALTQPGNRALLEFETPQDTLIGFDIYFPDYGIASNQSMDFIVHLEDGDNNAPTKNPILTLRDKTVTRQGFSNFYRVVFNPGIIVEGNFYVGWIAPPSGQPKVGFDISNDSGNRIFTYVNASWLRNDDDLHGSLMIRPFFGSSDIVTGIEEDVKKIALFPNPTKGDFFINGRFDDLTILSSTGQLMNYVAEESGENTRVSFRSSPGLYLVRLTKGNRVTTEKIIVVP